MVVNESPDCETQSSCVNTLPFKCAKVTMRKGKMRKDFSNQVSGLMCCIVCATDLLLHPC